MEYVRQKILEFLLYTPTNNKITIKIINVNIYLIIVNIHYIDPEIFPAVLLNIRLYINFVY